MSAEHHLNEIVNLREQDEKTVAQNAIPLPTKREAQSIIRASSRNLIIRQHHVADVLYCQKERLSALLLIHITALAVVRSANLLSTKIAPASTTPSLTVAAVMRQSVQPCILPIRTLRITAMRSTSPRCVTVPVGRVGVH